MGNLLTCFKTSKDKQPTVTKIAAEVLFEKYYQKIEKIESERIKKMSIKKWSSASPRLLFNIPHGGERNKKCKDIDMGLCASTWSAFFGSCDDDGTSVKKVATTKLIEVKPINIDSTEVLVIDRRLPTSRPVDRASIPDVDDDADKLLKEIDEMITGPQKSEAGKVAQLNKKHEQVANLDLVSVDSYIKENKESTLSGYNDDEDKLIQEILKHEEINVRKTAAREDEAELTGELCLVGTAIKHSEMVSVDSCIKQDDSESTITRYDEEEEKLIQEILKDEEISVKETTARDVETTIKQGRHEHKGGPKTDLIQEEERANPPTNMQDLLETGVGHGPSIPEDIVGANKLIKDLDDILAKNERKDPEKTRMFGKVQGSASSVNSSANLIKRREPTMSTYSEGETDLMDEILREEEAKGESLIIKDPDDILLHRRIPRPKTRRGPLPRRVHKCGEEKNKMERLEGL